jgi:hypothetical protein
MEMSKLEIDIPEERPYNPFNHIFKWFRVGGPAADICLWLFV